MWTWIFSIVLGICTMASAYIAFLGFRLDDSGAFVFLAFGVLFGIPFLVSVIKLLSKRSASLRKLDEKITGKPKPVRFVPHWFMMAALIIAAITILSAILIPLFFQ